MNMENAVEIASLGDNVKQREETFGLKAAKIDWLYEKGYDVPDTVFLPACGPEETRWFNEADYHQRLHDVLSQFRSESDEYNVALRSSPTCSDKFASSRAGQFDSFLGTMDFHTITTNLKKIHSSLHRESDDDKCEMGFVIQERIEATYSGVAFSSNPITGGRRESLVSFKSGQASPLVSGETTGNDVVISKDGGDVQIPPYELSLNESILESLFSSINEIEDSFGYPVDIEWSVEKNSGELYYLQCRPDTGILNYDDRVIPLTDQTIEKLPSRAKDNNQIRMQVQAKRNEIPVPQTHAIVIDCSEWAPTIPDLPDTFSNNQRRAYTVMLVYPDEISDEVKETSLPKRMQVKEFIEQCERYCVRSYPNYDSLVDDLHEISEMSCENYWEALVLVQQIHDPEYTGIIRRTTEGFLIEVGRGQLIAKGIIAASEYVVTNDREVIAVNEVKQERQFDIVDGYVLEAAVDGGQSRVNIPRELLFRVIDEFEPLLNDVGSALEFGIRRDSDKLTPYFIDAIQQEHNKDTKALLPSNNVVSTGRIDGLVDRIKDKEMKQGLKESQEIKAGSSNEKTILVCDRPDISLQSLLDRVSDDDVGFVFEKGSVLSHFSVILRERGIPAIKGVDVGNLRDGERVTIVAEGSSNGKLLRHEES